MERDYKHYYFIIRGIEKGIEVLILDNIENGVSREKTVQKLVKGFEISQDRAEAYYERIEQTEKSGSLTLNIADGTTE